jgi:exodeoxyribonuclease VII large subunit
LEITGRRWPAAEIVLAPVRVQGEGAAAEISAAIAAFNRLRCADVLIVGRGGGSLEDLWAFNEEPTVRAIAQSEIPIVSAVGHETDVTLADLAADVRAATPSHAAELITPDRADWAQQWRALGSALAKAPLKRLESAREKLEQASRSAAFRRPLDRLEYLREKLDDLQDELRPDAVRLVERLRERLGGMAAQLEGLSPLNVLARGYSVTRLAAGKVVRTVADAQPGAKLETRVADGIVRSTVED